MRILVGIPAFNEAATIADVIAKIPRRMGGIDTVSVAVVDDGSTDDTARLAREAGARVLPHPTTRGVGVAFQRLVRHALEVRADLLVTIDGDGQFDPADIPALIAPIIHNGALVSTASRFRDPSLTPRMPRVKRWGNRRVAALVSAITGRRYADVSCGFRAYARDALLRLTTYHSFTYAHETFLDLAAKGVPIEEVAVPVEGTRPVGESRIASNVLRYAWRTALIIVRTYRDHKPLKLCGVLAAPGVLVGVTLLTWSFLAFRSTGYWLKWAAFTGAAALATSLATVFLGFMADIATRLRQNQEEMLYWLRRRGNSGEESPPRPSS